MIAVNIGLFLILRLLVLTSWLGSALFSEMLAVTCSGRNMYTVSLTMIYCGVLRFSPSKVPSPILDYLALAS